MPFHQWVVFTSLAIFLFYGLNWIGRHTPSAFAYGQAWEWDEIPQAPAFNFFFRTLAPVVYLLLVSSILYWVGVDWLVVNIWMVTVLYFVFRALFNVSLGRTRLVNWPKVLLISALSIAASYVVYKHVIVTRQNLLPDTSNLANEMWVVIILFLYAIFNNIKAFHGLDQERRNEYVIRRFRDLRELYSPIVSENLSIRQLAPLVYAIMIVESFHRPQLYRIIEQLLFPRWSSTLGVMQVRTSERISDRESVRLGTQKIVRDFTAALQSQPVAADDWGNEESRYRLAIVSAAMEYNAGGSYSRDVLGVHDILQERFYPNLYPDPEEEDESEEGDVG